MTRGIITLMAAGWLMASCSTAADDMAAGDTGTVNLRVNVEDATRGGETPAGMPCRLTVTQASGKIVASYNTTAEIPERLTLLGGEYKATAAVGDSVGASFDARYYKGATVFTVTREAETTATVDCKIVNSAVAVTWGDEVDEVLHGCTVTVEHAGGKLTYGREEIRTGFFMTTSADPDLHWTLNGTDDKGGAFVKSGVIRNAKSGTLYRLNITFSGTVAPMGGALVEIDVDTTVREISDVIAVNDPPRIALQGGNIGDVLTVNTETVDADAVVTVVTTTALRSLKVECDRFTALGIPAESLDFATISDDDRAATLRKGVRSATRTGADGSVTAAVNFSRFFLKSLPPGENIIRIMAEDEAGMTGRATLTIKVD